MVPDADSEIFDIDVNPEECLNISFTFLKCAGLWPWAQTSAVKTIFSKSYFILSKLVLFYLTFSIPIGAYINRNTLEDIVELTILHITHTILLFKIYVFLFKEEEIRNLARAAAKNFYIHRDEFSTENRKIIRSTIKFTKIFSFTWAVLITIGFIIYTELVPIILSGYKEIDILPDVVNTSLNNQTMLVYKKYLPIKTWLPYDAEPSPYFEISYALLTIVCHVEGLHFAAADVIFITLVLYVTGQFELLCDALTNVPRNVKRRLELQNFTDPEDDNDISVNAGSLFEDKRIQGTALYNGQDNEDYQRHPFFAGDTFEDINESGSVRHQLHSARQNKYISNNVANISTSNHHFDNATPLDVRIQRETEMYLKECIKHHQSLIDFTMKLDELWSTIFFVQCLTASLLICFIGFEAMLVPFDINFLKMIMFLVCVLFQLGLFCTFGSNLMTQSEAVYNAAYDSEWYNQSEHCKKCIGMIIMRSQRPLEITAGRFGTLSLPLFASMIRSSYSYLALLRQMHGE